MSKWVLEENDADIALMKKVLKISEIMSNILANRGIRSKNSAIRYLNPLIDYFHDTRKMKDSLKAYEIIKNHGESKSQIVIYGDYDVDGVMSTTILTKSLRSLGYNVSVYIPHRELEGYGLNKNAVLKLKEAETDLIITCDNGISAFEEVELIKDLGMDIVIIDHHDPGFFEDELGKRFDKIPVADAIINPKQEDCLYPFKLLCAAGICYKFMRLFFELENKEFDLQKELIIFAAIATFCDVVDLQDENRIIAKYGLEFINNLPINNLGLKSILKEKSILEKQIGSFDVGFILGPCINATGRLESALIAVELFLTEENEVAENLSKKLSELNEERKEMTNLAVERAIDNILEDPFNIPPVIVYFDDAIHESIAGIVAGRVKDTFFHPTIVLTRGEKFVKGSARSIEAYNIFENLYKNRDLFERFGGHPMAAGLSLKEENIDIFRQRLNSNCSLVKEDFTDVIKVDMSIALSEVTFERAMELKVMEPFGKGNKEPLFLTKDVLVSEIRIIEDKNTIIFTFSVNESFRKLKGISFGKVEDFYELLAEKFDDFTVEKIKSGILRGIDLKLDLVYSMDINEYNGNVSVQMRIKDFK